MGKAGRLDIFKDLDLELLETADSRIELSLTVPITNSLAFLFTVLGEWWAEGKVISRGIRSPLGSSVDGKDR